ncbi:MAG: pilus assembly protein [Deltaproteobacteria bacterium]|nr:pilus assembly protein [Deltaproteobacteria bacterium]
MDRTSRFWKDTSGSITALTAVLLIAFVGALAFVVDLGHLHIVQNELRNAADDCALRGARAFLPQDITGMTAPPSSDWMKNNAETQASLAIADNNSDKGIKANPALKDLPVADMTVGVWNFATRTMMAWQWPPDAAYWGKMVGPGISLPVKRTDSYNDGPVRMSLASFLGKDEVSVKTTATAALTPKGGTMPGAPTLPFGTWGDLLTGIGQILHGTFKKDGTDTMGWTNLDPADTNPNASELKKMINDATGRYTPDCPTGSSVGIQNGVASSVIQNMIAPNNRFGLAPSLTNPDIYVPTGTNAAGVPYADVVYEMPVFQDNGSGDKFNQSAVVGAVPIKIVQVQGPPSNTIDVQIVGGNYVSPGYGGGLWYGILSPQPFLVQ